jgi:hypothetical protein
MYLSGPCYVLTARGCTVRLVILMTRRSADPLVRPRKAHLSSLTKDVRTKLATLCRHRTINGAATLLGASNITIRALLDAHGTASPETVTRITAAIERETTLVEGGQR